MTQKPQSNHNVDEVLQARRAKYGDSWLTPAQALEAILHGDYMQLAKLIQTGHFANWFMILGKLCRAVHSPDEIDHWVDIAGYAKISIEHIERRSSEF